MSYSPEFWKHMHTTSEFLFALELPYRPPTKPIGALVWRKRIWVETTFGLSLLEPCEKLMTLMFFYSLLLLTAVSVFKLLPLQISLFEDRMAYYFFGHDDKGIATVTRVVSMLAGHTMTHEF